MKTTILLDADIVAYKFAAANQTSVTFGEGEEPCVFTQPIQEVGDEVDLYIGELIQQLKADDLIVCLSCPSSENFRKQVLPTYKLNRAHLVPPILLRDVKDYLATHYSTYQRPTLEADDVMGILSTSESIVKGKKIIVSEDKDMQQIPGWLYNPRKDESPNYISKHDADYFHLRQTLTGDTVDGYKGCPGIGPKKAAKILMDGDDHRHYSVEEMWSRVVETYISKGLTEEDALVQARVARICRTEDYDFKGRKVILWQPQQTR